MNGIFCSKIKGCKLGKRLISFKVFKYYFYVIKNNLDYPVCVERSLIYNYV